MEKNLSCQQAFLESLVEKNESSSLYTCKKSGFSFAVSASERDIPELVSFRMLCACRDCPSLRDSD